MCCASTRRCASRAACAPIRLADVSRATSGDIPRRVALLDLFGTGGLDDLRPAERWETESEPWTSLGVPIGLRGGAEPLVLDLHDVTDAEPDAGGPNALVAGTVGSGKSELLLSLVASLSVHFHPHELVFALLDFKGGATSDAVRDLPHVVDGILVPDGVHAVAKGDVLDVKARARHTITGLFAWAAASRSPVRSAADVMMSRLPA